MYYKRKLFLIVTVIVLFIIQGCKKDSDTPSLDPILLDCDYFFTDQVLEDDPDRPVDYIVSCVAKVKANIVIKAGVVIEFEDDAGLNVSDGYLKVEGTADKKVVFTGVTKVKGSWRGIIFINKSVNNILDHAVVSYAGGNSFNSNNDRGNVICYNCQLSMMNSELSMGKEHGFNCRYGNGDILAFDNNVITGNDKYPIYSLTNFGHSYNGSNVMAGNGMDYIYLKGGQGLGDDRTWVKTNVPFLIKGNLKIGDSESLTLEAGATLLFESGSELDVSKGYLASQGEMGNMVLLSGLAEQPGSWLGIINSSEDTRNVIDYTEIAYAGGGAHNSNGDLGTIVVWSKAHQTVTNSILRDAAPAAGCAINAYFNAVVTLSNNSYINIENEQCH